MTYLHPIVQKDLQEITNVNNFDFEKLRNCSVLVTGATGMLATYLIYWLHYLNEHRGLGIQIIALARSESKVKEKFGALLDSPAIRFLYQDVTTPISFASPLDYIFHLAGGASPYAILHYPLDIIRANTLGTMNVFELARTTGAKVMYASTREVYGAVSDDVLELTEDTLGVLDSLDARSCYPGSKRMGETICKSSFEQYGVPYTVLRIAHVYGPLMNIVQDGRVMADLLSNAVRGEDITLNSTGSAVRAFCYITDALLGMLIATCQPEEQGVYNLANEQEPITILELAQLMTRLSPISGLQVTYRQPTVQELQGYAQFQRVMLCTNRLASLGWQPEVSLTQGVARVIKSFNS